MIGAGGYLGHLVEAIFRGKGGSHPLAFLEAYADEGGIHKQAELFCFGGLVGPADDWLNIQTEWRKALVAYGLDPDIVSFHMTDCVSGHGHFEGMPREDRAALVERLVGIISTGHCFCRYLEIYRGKPEERIGLLAWPAVDSYSFALLPFCRLISEAARAFIGDEEKIAFFFDQQKEWAATGTGLFNKLKALGTPGVRRFGTITYGSSLELMPLQAADLVTWELKHESERHRTDLRREPRRSYVRLQSTGRVDWYEWRRENLDEMITAFLNKSLDKGTLPVRTGRPGSSIEQLPFTTQGSG
jgi:hypothetical protein